MAESQKTLKDYILNGGLEGKSFMAVEGEKAYTVASIETAEKDGKAQLVLKVKYRNNRIALLDFNDHSEDKEIVTELKKGEFYLPISGDLEEILYYNGKDLISSSGQNAGESKAYYLLGEPKEYAKRLKSHAAKANQAASFIEGSLERKLRENDIFFHEEIRVNEEEVSSEAVSGEADSADYKFDHPAEEDISLVPEAEVPEEDIFKLEEEPIPIDSLEVPEEDSFNLDEDPALASESGSLDNELIWFDEEPALAPENPSDPYGAVRGYDTSHLGIEFNEEFSQSGSGPDSPQDTAIIDLDEPVLAEEASDITDMDTALTGEGIDVLGGDTESAVSDDSMAEIAFEDTALDSGAGTKAPADTACEASLEEIEDDVSLDEFGSGSGLLDLSLQEDDSSFGGILDEIYASESKENNEDTKIEDIGVSPEQKTVRYDPKPKSFTPKPQKKKGFFRRFLDL